jgi:hypothetical protein
LQTLASIAACGQKSPGWKIPVHSTVSQNMPLLGRVLGTAALASIVMTLMMSYQWSGAAEPPAVKVIRLHQK